MPRVIRFYEKINKQNARPGGDTEDKTFGKPFPDGCFYLFEIYLKFNRWDRY